jgi:hypothetical protein
VFAIFLATFLVMAVAGDAFAAGALGGFIENRGQVDEEVLYYSAGSRATLFVTGDALVLDVFEQDDRVFLDGFDFDGVPEPGARNGCAVWIRFEGAGPAPTVEAGHPLPGAMNFFSGPDQSDWSTNVTRYGEVVYRGLWPGIALALREDDGRVTFEILASGGADPSEVRFSYEGAGSVVVEADGTEVVSTPVGSFAVRRGGPHGSEGAIAWADDGSGAGALGRDDPSSLLWSTFLGGGSDDSVWGLALDGDDNSYVCGWTSSINFPTTPGAYSTSFTNLLDAFVTKLDPTGSTLVFSTYLGGVGQEAAYAIDLDGFGNVYVAGYASAGFPVTPGAFDEEFNGIYDCFVTKLDPTGSSLLYSTYIGGNASDVSWGLDVDGDGNAHICGQTNSASYPTTPSSFDPTYNGFYDGFVTKLDPAGVALVYSTFLGGTVHDRGCRDIEVDGDGSAYVTGATRSTNFPATPGAFQTTLGAGADAYAAKFDSTGSSLVYATYLGGAGDDEGRGIEIDGAGGAHVTGFTGSLDFPVTSGSYDETANGDLDAFLATFDPTGSTLDYGTYIGGTGWDYGWDIALDGSGSAHVAGSTSSSDFPTTEWAYDTTLNDSTDVFLSVLDPGTNSLSYSGYLGGTGGEEALVMALTSTGGAVLAGVTESSDFPTTVGAFDELYNGGSEDGFVALLDVEPPQAAFADATTGDLADTRTSYGTAWGDYDGDGDLDIFIANGDDTNALLRNEGGGVFDDVATGTMQSLAGALGTAWGDYDNDGDLDLYVSANGPSKLFRNDGISGFSDVTAGDLVDADYGQSCSWADYDLDGDLDLYYVTAFTPSRLLRNDGGDVFTDATAGTPLGVAGVNYGVAWGDYDNDGDPDVYVCRDAQNYLFRNDGGGTFTDVTTGPLGDTGHGHGVDWGDYDNDGDLDLYVGNMIEASKLLRNDGGGTFVDVTTPVLAGNGRTQGLVWFDYDNDGDLDLYRSQELEPNVLLRNDGGTVFTDVTDPPINVDAWGRGVAVADYDEDGDLDIYTLQSTASNKLFENLAAGGNSWLHVDLVGTVSNSYGIGARIRVVSGMLSQIREVRAGSSIFSENSLTAEFGFGSRSTVDSLIVHWPSGVVQILTDVDLNEKRVVTEPEPEGNVVCVPDPEYLTSAVPTKTVDVDYLGGGSDLLYAYSLRVTWDGSIVSTGPASVTEGSLLSSSGTTFFSADPTGTNELTIDCALLGEYPGVNGPGTMFSIEFTGLAVGSSVVDIEVLEARNADNVHLTGFVENDGLLIVDVEPPLVTDVFIENLTLAHTDDFIKNGDAAKVTALVTDDDPSFGIGDITADLTGLGGGAADSPDTYNTLTGEAVWTSTLLSVACTPADGTITVTVSAVDAIGNPATGADTIIADNTPPTAVTDFDAAPGHEKCELEWVNGTDLYFAGVVVQRTDNGGEYPEYPVFTAAWPFIVIYFPADETFGVRVYDDTGTSWTDDHEPRNIYYYQAFCYDEARNYGPAATTARDLATNYWLGDVAAVLGFWGYNGLVNDADIDKLGGTYYVEDPVWPHSQCDVGPTVHPDGDSRGLPLPDAFVEFEDLMVFAINYDHVSPRVAPFLAQEPTKSLALMLEERAWSQDGLVEVALVLEGNAAEVKGLSTAAIYDAGELEFLGARLSDEMATPLGEVFFWSGSEPGRALVDLAVLGTGVTIGGSGDVAIMTFRAHEGAYSLTFDDTRIRGASNEDLTATLEELESRPEIPTAYRLVGNTPNPFNPATAVAYNVPHESRVTIRVYDVSGRLVRTLVDGTVEPGRHEAVWNGRNDRGEPVGSGVYFCTMEAAGFSGSHKMVLLK